MEIFQISCLVLQIFLAFHQWYLYAFVLVTLLLFIYKGALQRHQLYSPCSLMISSENSPLGMSGIMLPYPPTGAYTWDLIFLFLYFIIENTRLFQGASAICLLL